MRSIVWMGLLCLVCSNVLAQSNKSAESDSTVFFYASMVMSNDLLIISEIDSITVDKKNVKKEIGYLNTVNKDKLLKYASNQYKSRLRQKNRRLNQILTTGKSIAALKAEQQKSIRDHSGSVLSLPEFRFTKNVKENSVKNVTRYEE